MARISWREQAFSHGIHRKYKQSCPQSREHSGKTGAKRVCFLYEAVFPHLLWMTRAGVIDTMPL
ncbi:hypothetical protein [Polystyrenella longa]|uniref:hypothetical protein n=1 Tax=Polystyrenella longa TaxID=2528007 RepID=UPI0011A8141F|nr:hypothetical protein [Polystyrenella longa]